MHFPRSGVAGNRAQSLHYPCSVTALVTVLPYPRSLMLLLATKLNTCHSFCTKTTRDGLVTHERGGTHRDHDPVLVGRPALQAGLPGNRRQLHRLALLAAQVGLEDCCRIRVPHLGLTGTSACKARTNTGPDGRAVGNPPPPHTHTHRPTDISRFRVLRFSPPRHRCAAGGCVPVATPPSPTGCVVGSARDRAMPAHWPVCEWVPYG